MKKFLLTLTSLATISISFGQYWCDFEDITLSTESAWYGQDQVIDGDTILISGYCSLENNYNSAWGSFAGWSVSNYTDNTTPGWGNQYSAITGGGDFSANYGVCYVSAFNGNAIYYNDYPEYFDYVMVTNTTYAYFAMLNGDSFSKPFGADTNAQGIIDGTNGEDWFLLTIYGLAADSSRTGDSINFYLADYRFSNDADDYIINEWTLVDLSQIQPIYGIEFELSSSDTSGGFGMNTPAYFALDNFGFYDGINEITTSELVIYPNPTNGILNVLVESGTLVSVFDSNGKLVLEQTASDEDLILDLSAFENGIYFFQTISDGLVSTQKVIKN